MIINLKGGCLNLKAVVFFCKCEFILLIICIRCMRTQKKYETSEIWLLYLVNTEMRNHQDITFDSTDGVSVRLFFVDVAYIENSLLALRKQLI